MEKNKLEKTQIIAEIANSHQGKPSNAIKLANKCIEAAADAVKFQIVLILDTNIFINNPSVQFNGETYLKKLIEKKLKYFAMYLEKILLKSHIIIKLMDLKYILRI